METIGVNTMVDLCGTDLLFLRCNGCNELQEVGQHELPMGGLVSCPTCGRSLGLTDLRGVMTSRSEEVAER